MKSKYFSKYFINTYTYIVTDQVASTEYGVQERTNTMPCSREIFTVFIKAFFLQIFCLLKYM